jgi:hypothetical protein
MSNFAVIQSEWSTLFGAASKAEGMANTDACGRRCEHAEFQPVSKC